MAPHLFLFMILSVVLEASSSSQSSLKLNEIFPNIDSGEVEWVEVYNPSLDVVSLDGYAIVDAKDQGLTLQSTDFVSEGGHFVAYFDGAILNNDGDTVKLLDNQGVVIDEHVYTSSTKSHSVVRFPDGGDWDTRMNSEPTPGEENSEPTVDVCTGDHPSLEGKDCDESEINILENPCEHSNTCTSPDSWENMEIDWDDIDALYNALYGEVGCVPSSWRDFFCDPAIAARVKCISNAVEAFGVPEGELINNMSPIAKRVFRAFHETDLSALTVALVGQDPPPQFDENDVAIASGLAWSLDSTEPEIGSIQTLRTYAISQGICFPDTQDVSQWATRGVFLYNSALTLFTEGNCDSGMGAMNRIWKDFSSRLYQHIIATRTSTAWTLFGKDARLAFFDMDMPPRLLTDQCSNEDSGELSLTELRQVWKSCASEELGLEVGIQICGLNCASLRVISDFHLSPRNEGEQLTCAFLEVDKHRQENGLEAMDWHLCDEKPPDITCSSEEHKLRSKEKLRDEL